MHHPSRKPSLYAFLCRFVSPPNLIFLGLWNPVSYVMNYIGLSRHWHQRLKNWHCSHMLFNDSISDAETMRETCRWITCSAQFGVLTTALLQIQASWVVALCQWGYSSRRFERSQRLHVLGLLDPEDEGAAIFETLELATDRYSRRLNY